MKERCIDLSRDDEVGHRQLISAAVLVGFKNNAHWRCRRRVVLLSGASVVLQDCRSAGLGPMDQSRGLRQRPVNRGPAVSRAHKLGRRREPNSMTLPDKPMSW